MKYDIRYLPAAEKDLDSIASYLSQFYPGTLSRFFEKLEHQVTSLKYILNFIRSMKIRFIDVCLFRIILFFTMSIKLVKQLISIEYYAVRGVSRIFYQFNAMKVDHNQHKHEILIIC